MSAMHDVAERMIEWLTNNGYSNQEAHEISNNIVGTHEDTDEVRDEDKPMTVAVYQLVRYDLEYYSGTPEMVVHQIESGPGWDDSNNEVIEDRVVIYRDNKVIHDTQPHSSLGIGPTQ